jgi:hypothetical protein
MVNQRKVLIGIISSFIVGCVIGLVVGGHQGFRYGTSAVVREALAKDAREVKARIATLRHLRVGEQDQALETLETGLSDLLIGFDPAEPYAGLDAQTVAALKEAIDEARKYRSEHPRPQKDFRDKMVDDLFARNLYE